MYRTNTQKNHKIENPKITQQFKESFISFYLQNVHPSRSNHSDGPPRVGTHQKQDRHYTGQLHSDETILITQRNFTICLYFLLPDEELDEKDDQGLYQSPPEEVTMEKGSPTAKDDPWTLEEPFGALGRPLSPFSRSCQRTSFFYGDNWYNKKPYHPNLIQPRTSPPGGSATVTLVLRYPNTSPQSTSGCHRPPWH